MVVDRVKVRVDTPDIAQMDLKCICGCRDLILRSDERDFALPRIRRAARARMLREGFSGA